MDGDAGSFQLREIPKVPQYDDIDRRGSDISVLSRKPRISLDLGPEKRNSSILDFIKHRMMSLNPSVHLDLRSTSSDESVEDEEEELTTTETSSPEKKPKKRKPKPFQKKAFIRKLLKLDKKIKSVQKIRTKTGKSKEEFYEQWTKTMNDYQTAHRLNSNLKKKMDNSYLEKQIGLPEIVRVAKAESNLRVHSKARHLALTYTKALAEVMKDLDSKNFALIRKLIYLDRKRINIHQEMDTYLNESWKDDDVKKVSYIKSFDMYAEDKEGALDLRLKQRLRKLSEKIIATNHKYVVSRYNRMQSVSQDNSKKLVDCLHVFSGITENNFFFVQKLSIAINGLKWKEIVRRMVLENLQKKLAVMKERLATLHERNLEMTSFVKAATRVRRSLHTQIQKRKILKFETNVASINHEYQNVQHKEASKRLEKASTTCKTHFLAVKKDYFKQCLMQGTNVSEQIMYAFYFEDFIKKLADDHANLKSLLTNHSRDELVLNSDGVRFTLGSFFPQTFSKMWTEYLGNKMAFNILIDFYKKRTSPECLSLEEFNFQSRSKMDDFSAITDYEKSVITKIKDDILKSTSDASHVSTWVF